MKKLFQHNPILFKLILFGIVVVFTDFVVGNVLKQIYFSQDSGKFARINKAIESEADIIILGSSTVNRHYVPEIVSKKLGKTCYNAGVQGQGLVFHTALQEMILKNQKPEVFVLNLDLNMLSERADVSQRLGYLLPLYDRYPKIVENKLNLKSPLEKVKLWSNLYRYNSTIVHALRYRLRSQKDYDGYRPLIGIIDSSQAPENVHVAPNRDVSEHLVDVLKSCIELTKHNNVQLVFTISPYYSSMGHELNNSQETMKKIAFDYGIPVFDYSNHPQFLMKKEFFKDHLHLNHQGAQLLSKLLANDILRMNNPPLDQ